MRTEELFDKIRLLMQKSPGYILRRLVQEARDQLEYLIAPCRAWAFRQGALLRVMGCQEVGRLWEALGEMPCFTRFESITSECYEKLCPGDEKRILEAAQAAIERRVNLLGSGWVNLGSPIDWSRDYKTGYSWPLGYFRKLNYLNPKQPNGGYARDVKFPWELSRLQWLIPAGQAYRLTGDEKYALAAREILEEWMAQNPYGQSINWACAMEAAMRIFTWSWLFHAFRRSRAWEDPGFRLRFLSCLYLHGDFTARHLEYSDINGNHYTANAAGLTVAGLFFGENNPAARRWSQRGWEILSEEIVRQVYPDGVDFEMSVAYHRLVLELFFLAALCRKTYGLPVSNKYLERLIAMARFTAAYSRDSLPAPLWGDADDGRALPFGGQSINDHRYLAGLTGIAFQVPDLIDCFSGSRAEVVWWLGPDDALKLPDSPGAKKVLDSQAFPDAGFYIMRNERDHIFIDCGPVGLAGRGGHGHNDCLSFAAVLDGVELITDCGAYLYTASYEERNRFRSTACHNTPQIDGMEINRWVRPDNLWSLHFDAYPQVKYWGNDQLRAIFTGSHSGYQKLNDPVIPERTVILEHRFHALSVHDRFWGNGAHLVTIPLHLAPGVEAGELASGRLRLWAEGRGFWLDWADPGAWELKIEPARISPSYGVIQSSFQLIWRRFGVLDKSLTLLLRPADKKNESGFNLEKVFELLNHPDNRGAAL
ncbi:MAG: heparinase II/III family protein [Firmicutes bacterium]|nr:heparinase II/III family protein [Bacillota bacterium]